MTSLAVAGGVAALGGAEWVAAALVGGALAWALARRAGGDRSAPTAPTHA